MRDRPLLINVFHGSNMYYYLKEPFTSLFELSKFQYGGAGRD